MKTSTSEFNVCNEGAVHICKLPRFATTGKVLLRLATLSNQENLVYTTQTHLAKLLDLSVVGVNQAMRILKQHDYVRSHGQIGWMLNPHYFCRVSPKLAKSLIKTFEALPKYTSTEN